LKVGAARYADRSSQRDDPTRRNRIAPITPSPSPIITPRLEDDLGVNDFSTPLPEFPFEQSNLQSS
jgi:hypothetical protein